MVILCLLVYWLLTFAIMWLIHGIQSALCILLIHLYIFNLLQIESIWENVIFMKYRQSFLLRRPQIIVKQLFS